MLTQPFMQLHASFTPLALDTEHPDYVNWVLIGESERMPVGGGLVTWTRTYAKVPPDHNEYESHAYNFIGYAPDIPYDPTAIIERPRRVFSVTSRVAHHYVLTTTPATANPVILAQRYTQGVLANGRDIDLLYNATGAYSGYTACVPTLTQYLAAVTGGAGSGLGTGAADGEIVAEESRLTRWQDKGNIWLRQTRYVKAL